jgi:hypothetical protein
MKVDCVNDCETEAKMNREAKMNKKSKMKFKKKHSGELRKLREEAVDEDPIQEYFQECW